MTVYKHEQRKKGLRRDGKPYKLYKKYRVARFVNGKMRQDYFPRTRKGFQEAKELDDKWREEAHEAAKEFTGPAARWNPLVGKGR